VSIFQLLYVSGATRPISPSDLDDILASSRRNNETRDVTGVLLYADDTFIQVLEGDRATVGEVARVIRRDPRHRNFMVLVERNAEKRAFSQWQMGFKRLDPSKEQDGSVFKMSRQALHSRMKGDDDGLMLDAIMAFASADFMEKAG
jgi:hypothetical protein